MIYKNNCVWAIVCEQLCVSNLQKVKATRLGMPLENMSTSSQVVSKIIYWFSVRVLGWKLLIYPDVAMTL